MSLPNSQFAFLVHGGLVWRKLAFEIFNRWKLLKNTLLNTCPKDNRLKRKTIDTSTLLRIYQDHWFTVFTADKRNSIEASCESLSLWNILRNSDLIICQISDTEPFELNTDGKYKNTALIDIGTKVWLIFFLRLE